MIQVDKLSISYNGIPLFQDLSFALQKQERCALIGRNGCGKSTLLRLITGQEEQDSGVISLPKNYRLGYLKQSFQFTQGTVLEEAALGLPENKKDHLYEAEKILFGLGLTEEQIHQPPSELSGGFHLRLELAKVLLSEPDCLLLDEPTNYLDILSIRWLTQFLQSWKNELLVVSHDRDFLDRTCTHSLAIHRKKMHKIKGSTGDLFEQILQEEEVYEKTRANLEKKRAHAQSYIERFGAKATKAAQAQSRQKMISKIPALEKLKELYNLDFQFQEAPFHSKKFLDASHLHFFYQEGNPIIQDFSMAVEKNDRIAIIGKNGYGKSTLLRLLAKDLPPLEGEVKYSDNVSLGYFGQTNIGRLDPSKTIEDEIAEANPTLNLTQVKQICGIMMFSGDVSKKKTSVLSGGEKSRVLLGKILAKKCNLLFLDEPTHHLDIESIEALIDALEEFQGSYIIVTHSELFLRRLDFTKLVICHEGRQMVFQGSYDEFLEKVGWEEEEKVSFKKPTLGDRQKRAEWVAERAKTLKPIEMEISRCENSITQLEDLQKEEQNELLAISESQSSTTRIAILAKSLGEKEKKLNDLYDKLQELHIDYEKKKKSFEENKPL